jgi:hypothetical protein
VLYVRTTGNVVGAMCNELIASCSRSENHEMLISAKPYGKRFPQATPPGSAAPESLVSDKPSASNPAAYASSGGLRRRTARIPRAARRRQTAWCRWYKLHPGNSASPARCPLCRANQERVPGMVFRGIVGRKRFFVVGIHAQSWLPGRLLLLYLSLFAREAPRRSNPSTRRPSIRRWCSPSSEDYPRPAPNGIHRRSKESLSPLSPARAAPRPAQ